MQGEYSLLSRRMSYPIIDAERRTDHSFRARIEPQHHKLGVSPMEELPIDMIFGFPTSDPLHLLELGVMRKCLYRWVLGAKRYQGKWKRTQVERISQLLRQTNLTMPSDIHRSVRTLNNLRY